MRNGACLRDGMIETPFRHGCQIGETARGGARKFLGGSFNFSYDTLSRKTQMTPPNGVGTAEPYPYKTNGAAPTPNPVKIIVR